MFIVLMFTSASVVTNRPKEVFQSLEFFFSIQALLGRLGALSRPDSALRTGCELSLMSCGCMKMNDQLSPDAWKRWWAAMAKAGSLAPQESHWPLS